ncbi:MAG TPA: hypothetical protein VHW60_12635 [Caulobacteraceae bacterium]|jgi:hypothetical protein|nr:hypothetical protein [Caulobacteraceae bacterium]
MHDCFAVKRLPTFGVRGKVEGHVIAFALDPNQDPPINRAARMGVRPGPVKLQCTLLGGAFTGCVLLSDPPTDFGYEALHLLAKTAAPMDAEAASVEVDIEFFVEDPGDPTNVPCT